MDGMPARQILWRLTRREHVFSAHRAIVLVLIFETLVGIEYTYRYAHAAFITMAEGICTSDSAKTALGAMEWLLTLL